MKALWRPLVGTVIALVLASPSAQASNPDLSVYRIRSLVYRQPATTLRDQDPVTFRVFARNLGPGTSDMYVTYSNTRRLYVKNETCIVPASEAGDFSNVSADSPSCEWTDVPAGDYAIVRVNAYAVGQPGQHVRIRFCSSNGVGADDADASNDCQTSRLTIVAS